MTQVATSKDVETIELIIDRLGWAQFTEIVSTIAYEKSEHVATNWQDKTMAATLERIGRKFNKLVASLEFNDEVLGYR